MDKQVDRIEVDYSSGHPAPKDMAAAAGLYKLDPEKCKTELQYNEWVSLVARVLNKRRSSMQTIEYNWWPADPRLPITPEATLGIPSDDDELQKMRTNGRFDRCASDLKVTVENLTGDQIINWCTGKAVTEWTKWVDGSSKPSQSQFRNELITDRLAIASYLPDIFINAFFMGEVPNWNALISQLRFVCELKPAELEWVTFMDILRQVAGDRKSNLTSKLLRLQDGLRAWYARPGNEIWEYGDLFAKQHRLSGEEKYSPIIAHLLLSICVMIEPNDVIFDAEKYASRACNTPLVDSKMWVTGRHEAIRYLIEQKKCSRSKLAINLIEEDIDESDTEQVYFVRADRKFTPSNRRQSSGPTGKSFSTNRDRRGATGTGRLAQKSKEYPARGSANDTKNRDRTNNRNKSYTKKVRACLCNALQLYGEEHGDDEICPVGDKLAKVNAYLEEIRASSDTEPVQDPTDDEYDVNY